MLHLAGLNGCEGHVDAGVVLRDDVAIEGSVGEHIGHDLVVGGTLPGDLCG